MLWRPTSPAGVDLLGPPLLATRDRAREGRRRGGCLPLLGEVRGAGVRPSVDYSESSDVGVFHMERLSIGARVGKGIID